MKFLRYIQKNKVKKNKINKKTGLIIAFKPKFILWYNGNYFYNQYHNKICNKVQLIIIVDNIKPILIKGIEFTIY